MSRVVLDTSGWLAYFGDEPHADRFAPYIEGSDGVVVPALVDYEVYRWALRERGERAAIQCAAILSRNAPAPLDAMTARRGAELGHLHKLAACDALVLAVADVLGLPLVTADEDFRFLPGGEFHEKPGRTGHTPKAKRAASRRPTSS